MSDPSAAPPKESLATRIEGEKSHPLAWKTVVTRAAMLAVTGQDWSRAAAGTMLGAG